MEKTRYITVEGPIGVGKTSLVKSLAAELNGRSVMERVEDNPFLPRFYEDRETYAFQTQIFFLLSRYRQQRELMQQDLFSQNTVADYLFSKDRIFATLTLNPEENALYQQVYQILNPRVPKPDLVVYLQARPEILFRRIKKRNHSFERGKAPEADPFVGDDVRLLHQAGVDGDAPLVFDVGVRHPGPMNLPF